MGSTPLHNIVQPVQYQLDPQNMGGIRRDQLEVLIVMIESSIGDVMLLLPCMPSKDNTVSNHDFFAAVVNDEHDEQLKKDEESKDENENDKTK